MQSVKLLRANMKATLTLSEKFSIYFWRMIAFPLIMRQFWGRNVAPNGMLQLFRLAFVNIHTNHVHSSCGITLPTPDSNHSEAVFRLNLFIKPVKTYLALSMAMIWFIHCSECYFLIYCSFNAASLNANSARFNTVYGGLNPSITNAIFVHGTEYFSSIGELIVW